MAEPKEPNDQQKDNEDKDGHERLRQRVSAKRPSDNHQCTICLNSIRDLSFADCCLHAFCRSCIIEWARRSNHCPVCRTIFNNVLTNIQPDSNFDSIPIEPPPEINSPVPFINIVRDIIVSPNGLSTVIRTRIINEEGTTEITESRGTGRQSPVPPAIGPNPESDSTDIDPSSTGHPPTTQGHRRSSIEMEEVDRFMGLLFRSLLSPEPLSPVSFIENPTEAHITRSTRPEPSPIPKILGKRHRLPPPYFQSPRFQPPIFIPFHPPLQQQQQRPPLMIKRRPKFLFPPVHRLPQNWPRQSFKNISPQNSMSFTKTLPGQLSSKQLGSKTTLNRFSNPFEIPSHHQNTPSPTLTTKSSDSDQNFNEDQTNSQNRRIRRRRDMIAKSLSQPKEDEPSKGKKTP